ncbi:MAG: DUF982 domain-containing protein [Mesorhizobium sp.]|jgi:hypothetical protein
MNQVKFDRSVSVFIGLGFPREIANVVEAYDILIEWKGIRDLDQNGAIEVCRKALNGERTGRDARLAFQKFALNKGILSEEAYSRAAATLRQEWSIHR